MALLASTYRPVRFADMVGQGHIKPVLRAIVKAQDPPPSMIFGGSRGTGKTSAARILAAALNCTSSTSGDACGTCDSCRAVQETASLAVLEVDAASNTGVENIRDIKDLCTYATDGLWRVVLLDEAHSLSKQAFNALLKVLEEPPPRTVFVLLTTEVEKILETVRSRSMAFEFRRLSVADIVGRLRYVCGQETIEATDDLLSAIAVRADGGMRDAVMILDQCRRTDISTIEKYNELLGVRDIAAPLILRALDQKFAEGNSLLDEYFYQVGEAGTLVSSLVTLLRDVLVLKGDGQLVGSEADISARKDIASRLSVAQAVSIIRILWELKSRTRSYDDQRVQLEMAFVLISDVTSLKKAEPVTITPKTTVQEPVRVASSSSLRDRMARRE